MHTLSWWHLESQLSSCTALLLSISAGRPLCFSCCLTRLQGCLSFSRRHAHLTCMRKTLHEASSSYGRLIVITAKAWIASCAVSPCAASAYIYPPHIIGCGMT